VAVVSIGCGANLLFGFAATSSAGGPSFELLVVVSIGSGANLRLGFAAVSATTVSFSSNTSLELLTEVSTGSGANRLLCLTGSSGCFGVSFEVLVVVSTGSTAKRRGFLTIVLAVSAELSLVSCMMSIGRSGSVLEGSFASVVQPARLSGKSQTVLWPECGFGRIWRVFACALRRLV